MRETNHVRVAQRLPELGGSECARSAALQRASSLIGKSDLTHAPLAGVIKGCAPATTAAENLSRAAASPSAVVEAASASREVARLGDAGILLVRGSRNARQVSADVDSAIFPELQGLLLKTVGPKPVLESFLRNVAGIEAAFIYGSWARRYEGEAGAPPTDIDLLVVGTPEVDAVYDAAEKTSSQLSREVNPTILTSDEWEASSEGFIEHVRQSPLVRLDLSHSHSLDAS